jgi:glycyl-tRNA synthetase beta chain
MGRYYALHDGEPRAVADAIEAHYRPRFAGDRLPEDPVGCALALADKLDGIAGLFAIGETPTGDKDPFGLRRAALGVIRILIERKLPLALPELIKAACAPFKAAESEVSAFIYERARGYLREGGYSANEIEAVLSLDPARLDLVPLQLQAVRAFSALPEADSLAAANKRVVNILKQAQAKGEAFERADATVLKEPAERRLLEALRKSAQSAGPLFERGDYTGYLKSFAVLKSPVDEFFDSVMVMVDEAALRRSRLALLRELQVSMNRVADLSKLAK